MRIPEPHCNPWPDGVTLPPSASGSNLFERLETGAALYPEAVVATDVDGCRLTCQQLLDASLVLAGYMQQRLELRRGERVLLRMPANPARAIAWYATLRCDAVVVAIAPDSAPGQVARCAWNTSARIAIVMHDELHCVTPLLGRGRLRGSIAVGFGSSSGQEAGVPRRPRVHAFADAIAAGIAPMPMRATSGDLAVLAYAADAGDAGDAGDELEIVQWHHGDGNVPPDRGAARTV